MSTTNTLDLNNRVDALENFSHNVEPIQQQIDELKAWTDSGTKDASGNPIILTDGAAFNAVDLKVSCNPKQNLHGYDHPWAGGAGKNKLPMTVASVKALNVSGTWSGNKYTHVSGMTVDILTDTDDNVIGFDFNGTASEDSINFPIATNVRISNGSYIINTPTASGKSGMWLSTSNPNKAIFLENNTSDTVTVDNGSIGTVYLFFNQNTTLAHYIIRPMLRLASVSDATFEPYSNECPITGYTECVVEVKDEEETTQDNATIAFGQTVYGCNVDAKSGKVTVTHKFKQFDGSESWNENTNGYLITRGNGGFNDIKIASSANTPIITNMYQNGSTTWTNGKAGVDNGTLWIGDANQSTYGGLDAFKTFLSNNNLQMAYPLATPIELTLTPAELELLKGYNYITTNGDNIELTYQPDNLKADIMLTVSQLYGSKISIFDGILAGGDTGQVLTKTTDDNYDATWETLPATRTTTRKSEK